MQQALLDPLMPSRSVITLVARRADVDAVGQCTRRSGRSIARLTFIGPAEVLDHDGGLELLEALAAAAGESGAHNLVAEVDEGSAAFERLRQAGFAIYARQRIWSLDPGSVDRPNGDRGIWRLEKDRDKIPAQSLYLNIVPGLVQQVEPAPSRAGHNMVYYREGELLGYLDLERGSLGTWVQAFFHPAVEDFYNLLGSFLGEVTTDRPVYACVRSYQSWMGGPLERLGFEPASDQAVMVKRLAVQVRKPATSPLPAVEGTYPEPTAPIARIEDPAGL